MVQLSRKASHNIQYELIYITYDCSTQSFEGFFAKFVNKTDSQIW